MAIDPVTGSLLGSGMSAGGSLLGSLVGSIGARKSRRQLMKIQRKTWRREDTAVQRRVKDLKAAGLNPVLAAGQGAQASAPTAGIASAAARGERYSKIGEGIASMPKSAEEAQSFASTYIDNQLKQEQLRELRWKNEARDMPATWLNPETGRWEVADQFENKFILSELHKMNQQGLRTYAMQLENQIADEKLEISRYEVEKLRQYYTLPLKDMGLTPFQIDLMLKAMVYLREKQNQKIYQRVPQALIGASAGMVQKGMSAIPGIH